MTPAINIVRFCLCLGLTCTCLVVGRGSCSAGAQSDFKPIVVDLLLDSDLFQRLLLAGTFRGASEVDLRAAYDKYVAAVVEIDRESAERMRQSGLSELQRLHAQHRADVAGASGADAARLEQEFQLAVALIHEEHGEELRREKDRACLAGRSELDRFLSEIAQMTGMDETDVLRLHALTLRNTIFASERIALRQDFDYSFDLYDLIEEACAPGAELEWLHVDERGVLGLMFHGERIEANVEPKARIGCQTIRDILSDYDFEMNAALHLEADDRRRSRLEPAVMQAGELEFKREMRERGSVWARRDQAAWNAANRVTALLLDNWGQEFATRWQRRFDNAVCPRLVADRWPVNLAAWAFAWHLPQDQCNSLSDLLLQWEQRQRALEGVAMDLARDIRRAKFLLDFQQTEAPDLEYARAKLAIHRHNVQLYASVCAQLSPDYRKSLDEHLFGDGGTYDPLLFGPEIDWAALMELEVNDEYKGGWRHIRSDRSRKDKGDNR